MDWMTAGRRAALALGALMTLAACSSYPDAPRYPIYAGAATPVSRTPAYPTTPAPADEAVRAPANPAVETPPPPSAAAAEIEGGALDAPVSTGPGRTPAAGPASEGFAAPPPPAGSVAAVAGASYVIQPGDTISGIGRRFQTPVQVLIDLNALGPRADISPGQRLILPQGAVDVGGDPYAT
uniref:LysM peptidoglycan-binding domain-containing protein n=1 Tax=Brevundimonas sp. TaxID=1871086 RepID=UPI0035AFD9C7